LDPTLPSIPFFDGPFSRKRFPLQLFGKQNAHITPILSNEQEKRSRAGRSTGWAAGEPFDSAFRARRRGAGVPE